MSDIEIGESEQNFLAALFEKTKGDTSAQASMFDVGAALNLDKSEASRIAEELIGWELVEVRTLSGGIGITESGMAEIQKQGFGAASEEGGACLGNEPILGDPGQQAVAQWVTGLKNQTSSLGADFDTLSELMADMKTIDAQLASSRPKTAILRECLLSLRSALEKTGGKTAEGSLRQIRRLLGDG